MNETKIISATVSVTLSHNSNYFKVELGIENEAGLNLDEINDYRLQAHDLAEQAIIDYRVKIQSEIQERKFAKKDTISVSEIEKMPTWEELKKRQSDNKNKSNAKG